MTQSTGMILVVDDDKLNRTILTNQLEIEGHTVLAAANGRQAIGLLHTNEFDVVLLDLLMPDIDGFAVLEYIRTTLALQHLPVIIISALDEMESVVRSIHTGATDHLVKPCNPLILRARINASLAAKRARDQQAEYLQQVGYITQAAANLEAGTFQSRDLDPVVGRADGLGQLARVFSHMAKEVFAREQTLHQQSAIKSALIGKITHELRSPFVAAALSVQVLERYVEHDMHTDLPQQIRLLQRQLTEGRTLIDRIIVFASLVGRQADLRLEATDIAQLIEHTILPLQQLARTRGIIVRCDIAPSLPTIALDREQIGEAIQHLVHNAIKFTSATGSVRVDCYYANAEVVFCVEDTGCGIDARSMTTIWDAFTQTSDDVRRGVEGLGLGLALVKYVVQSHGGRLLAQSIPGSGSTFGFALRHTS